MKTNLRLLSLLLAMPLMLASQPVTNSPKPFTWHLSLGYAAQVHAYPYDLLPIQPPPEYDGKYDKYITGFLPVLGLGLGYSLPLTDWLAFHPRLFYQQKGTSDRQKAYMRNEYIINDAGERVLEKVKVEGYKLNNRFHYLSADLLLQAKLGKRKLQPYLLAGIRNDMLLTYSLDFDLDNYSGNNVYPNLPFQHRLEDTPYPENSNYRDFKRHSIGWLFGLGVEVSDCWHIGLELSYDLNHMVNAPKMKVNNSTAVVVLGMRF